MPLETGDFISDLVVTNPLGTDPKSEGDDHLRLLKKVIQQTFADHDRLVRLTAEQMNGFTGMIGAFPEQTDAGKGWLICNGTTQLRADFPDLFTFLGLTYGPGDGSTNFVLPDYRGQFLRGLDEGAGNDPDALSRGDRGDGVTGDKVGTTQGDIFDSHSHTGGFSAQVAASGGGSFFAGLSAINTGLAGGSETRPKNIYVQYFIHI